MVPAGYVHRKDSSVLGHRYTNTVILGSFFFKKSHKQQGSAIRYLPESPVCIPASYNFVVVLYFRYPIMMNYI